MFSFCECFSIIDYKKVIEFNICVYDSVIMFRFNFLKIKDKYVFIFVLFL